jgi:hypothetical protein
MEGETREGGLAVDDQDSERLVKESLAKGEAAVLEDGTEGVAQAKTTVGWAAGWKASLRCLLRFSRSSQDGGRERQEAETGRAALGKEGTPWCFFFLPRGRGSGWQKERRETRDVLGEKGFGFLGGPFSRRWCVCWWLWWWWWWSDGDGWDGMGGPGAKATWDDRAKIDASKTTVALCSLALRQGGGRPSQDVRRADGAVLARPEGRTPEKKMRWEGGVDPVDQGGLGGANNSAWPLQPAVVVSRAVRIAVGNGLRMYLRSQGPGLDLTDLSPAHASLDTHSTPAPCY